MPRALGQAEARGRTRLLRRAVEEGELSPEADLEVTLDALFGPLYHRFLLRHAPVTPAFAERIFESAMAGVVSPGARKRLGLS